MGCYFSVNAAMSEDALARIPLERMLPETDFPAGKRRGGGNAPGDTLRLELKISRIHRESTETVRRRFYRNLRTIAISSGAIERLPDTLADRLLAV
jgi:TatD DNase family protein